MEKHKRILVFMKDKTYHFESRITIHIEPVKNNFGSDG